MYYIMNIKGIKGINCFEKTNNEFIDLRKAVIFETLYDFQTISLTQTV